jgi:asparagine synthase (glutamine-hydrolysing)
MCGVAAVIGLHGSPPSRSTLEALSDALAHRGPDGAGMHVEGSVALAHRRLAVIDLATGAQPMQRGACAVTYNGELYNYIELRQRLLLRGHAFATSSDTEVLLAAYQEFGVSCVEHFVGMFAFILHDRERGIVLAARDPLGIKPLYWHRNSRRVLFASEPKALLADPAISRRIDRAALDDYITLQYTLGESTLFADIRRLQPATRLVIDVASGRMVSERYWQPAVRVDPSISEADAVDRIGALIEQSIAWQLRSDVPVGAYLSGGLDSSLVTAMAARRSASGFPAFTGAFTDGTSCDERVHARAVAQHTGASLVEVVPTSREFVDVMPRLLYTLDEPTAGPGLFPQYMVAKAARERVTVVLGGQGGDEVFGGYARYLVAYLEQALKGAIQGTADEGEHVVSLRSLMPNLRALNSYQPMLQSFWRDGLFDDMDLRYLRLIDRSAGLLPVLHPDLVRAYAPESVTSRYRSIFHHPDTESYLAKMTMFDLGTSLPALLQVEDRVSMAHALESRVPFVDHRLVDAVGVLPPRYRFAGGELKALLRRIARPWLPHTVVERRDKMGFPVPLREWVHGDARDFVNDTLRSAASRDGGLLAPAAVDALLTDRAVPERAIWGALSLSLWQQTFATHL